MAAARTGRTGDEGTQAVHLRDQARDRASSCSGRVRTASRRGIRAPFTQYQSPTGPASIEGRAKTGCDPRDAADLRPIAETLTGERDRDAAQGGRAVARRGRVPGKIAGLEVTGTTLKVQAVEDLKAQYPLSLLLQIAHLPRSTFYDHRNRLARADRHAELKEAIRQAFGDAKGAYGHRRILPCCSSGVAGVEEDGAEADAHARLAVPCAPAAEVQLLPGRSWPRGRQRVEPPVRRSGQAHQVGHGRDRVQRSGPPRCTSRLSSISTTTVSSLPWQGHRQA